MNIQERLVTERVVTGTKEKLEKFWASGMQNVPPILFL